MLFKKNFKQKETNGVQMVNGTISFQKINLNVYCFFVDGVLIDTGGKSLQKQFQSFFKQLDIDKVAITHHHEDHTGNATFLQEERGLPIYASDLTRGICLEKDDNPLYRRIFWGRRKAFTAETIGSTFTSKSAVWDVIETPGHAIDHLAFLNNETGQLFSGDLYCQEKTKVVLRDESIPEIIKSLQKVLTYDFNDVFCNHAGYIENGRIALEQKLDYLLHIQGEVLKMYDEGCPPSNIKATLFPKKYPITFFSQGEWDSLHIVTSIINGNKLFC